MFDMRQFTISTMLSGIVFCASAGTLSVPTLNPIEIGYDSAIFSNASLGLVNCGPDNEPVCFATSFLPTTKRTSDDVVYTLSFSASATINMSLQAVSSHQWAQDQNVQLRFSYPRMREYFSARDLDSGAVLVPETQLSFSHVNFDTASWNSRRFEITYRIDLDPGHFVSPSFDPSCASISCMTPGEDEALLWALYVHTVNVPEPATVFMLMAGGALVGTRRRLALRRR